MRDYLRGGGGSGSGVVVAMASLASGGVVRCIAMHHDTAKPLGVFTELRRCACNAFARRELGWVEGKKRRSGEERMVEKVLSNAVGSRVRCSRNTIILVTSLCNRASCILEFDPCNSPWHRTTTEVGDLFEYTARTWARTGVERRGGEVSDRAVLRLLTTPNRFRFEHDSYIKG